MNTLDVGLLYMYRVNYCIYFSLYNYYRVPLVQVLIDHISISHAHVITGTVCSVQTILGVYSSQSVHTAYMTISQH